MKNFFEKYLLLDFLIIKSEIYELRKKGHFGGRGITML